MQKLIGIIFILSWLLCGCTLDTFFDGGAPVFLISLLVVVVSAVILAGNDNN